MLARSTTRQVNSLGIGESIAVILSAAKNLVGVAIPREILRYAQNDNPRERLCFP